MLLLCYLLACNYRKGSNCMMNHHSCSQPPFTTLFGWLHWLETTRPEYKISLGLDRIRKIAERSDLLSHIPCVITVGGTNGKGSTVAFLESMLLESGVKVGVYTSPHFLRFNERIHVNGVEVADEILSLSFQKINEARDGNWLTYFEFAVLVAINTFQQEKVDVALMEVGLGGRLDATNVIEPDISIITSIGLDHQELLGYNIEAIAKEKSGIMRPDKPVVFGGEDTPSSVIDHSIRLKSDLYRRGHEFHIIEFDDSWIWLGKSKRGEKVEYSNLPLPHLVIDNAASAIQALQFLVKPPVLDAIKAGITNARIPGRYENRIVTNTRGESIKVVLDVAHNPQAATKLVSNLQKNPVLGKTRAILAMYANKDCAGVIDVLSEVVDEWVVTDCKSQRMLSNEALFNLLKMRDASVSLAESVESAYLLLLEYSTENDCLLITGSFLTVAAVLRRHNFF